MNREQWLEQRRTGIGGSDIAAILGLSRYKTPLQVWREKRGEVIDDADNAAMRWGRYLEPVVRQAYADETGREVLLPSGILRHPTRPFMVASLDGFTEDRRVFEAKTARTAEGWGEAGSDQVPQAYLLQVQWYMAITGFAVADVAALIGGSDFRVYPIEADAELHELMIDAAAEFWRSVERGEPPEPLTVSDAVARWGRSSRADLVMADDAALRAIADLREIRTHRDQLERAEEAAKAIVLRALGECDTLVDAHGKTLCTWRASAGATRFDAKAFAAAHPALHAEFMRQGEPCRRFLLKG